MGAKIAFEPGMPPVHEQQHCKGGGQPPLPIGARLAGAIAEGEAGSLLRAPMPGLVTTVCAPGSRVRAGEPLVLMEAMKMLHTLSAQADGRVVEVCCRVGDAVRGGDVLVRMELESKA